MNWTVWRRMWIVLWSLIVALTVVGCSASVQAPSTDPAQPSAEEAEKLPAVPDPPPTLVGVEYGERLIREDASGRQVYVLPSPTRIRVSVDSAQTVEVHLFQPVGDDQEPFATIPLTVTGPGTWAVDLELPSDDPIHLEILAEMKPNTPDQKGYDYVTRRGKRWRFLSGALVARAAD